MASSPPSPALSVVAGRNPNSRETTEFLSQGSSQPRSGGRSIAWGVSPRESVPKIETSREAATDNPEMTAAVHAAATICRPLGALGFCNTHHLGLTPQAMSLSRLRRLITSPIPRNLSQKTPNLPSDRSSQPRSGGILIAWGVNPRVENQHNRNSREGATDPFHPGIDNLRHATSREAATDP